MGDWSPAPLSTWETREPSMEAILGVLKGFRVQAAGSPPPMDVEKTDSDQTWRGPERVRVAKYLK